MAEKENPRKRKPQYFLACFPAKPIELEPGRVYSIGRGEGNTIVLPEQEVSRKHALITWDGVQFVLKDLGSANGTFVDGVRITEQELADGAEIRLGVNDTRFQFKIV